VNPRRILLVLYAVVLLAFSIGAGAVLFDAYAQYKQLKQTEAANRIRLAQAEARLHEQEVALQRLTSDPAYIERAIRERLKYAKPGEVIFRFPSD
jgi:cell division protein FtsB